MVMLKLTQRLLKCKKGAALVEYALLVAGVALIGSAAVSVFGHKTNDMLAMTAAVLPGAHTGDNGAIASGHLIETTPGAVGSVISVDADAIMTNSGTTRLGTDVGGAAEGALLTALVVEP
jgi:Flp pilus assembly pilin Flp